MKKCVAAVLTAVLTVGSLCAIGGKDTASGTEKVLKIGTSSDSGLLNPFRHVKRGPGIFKMRLVHDSLLELGTEKDIPWLAKSYESNDEQTEYIFHLQKNVKWHDGKPFSADDVVFTFNYYKDHPPVRNDLLEKDEYIIKSIEKIDTDTVKVCFTGFNLTYLHRLGMMRIIPKHIWEKVTDPKKFEGEGCTVGCGPFMLTKYEPEKPAYRLEAFKDYWGRKPVADVVEYIPASNRVLAFENGEIDIAKISPDMLPRFENKADCTVVKYHSHHCYRLFFNMEKRPELQEKAVRHAFAYGINREDAMKKLTRGYGSVSPMGYLIEEHPMYNPDIRTYGYDKEKAANLLNGKKLAFTMIVSNSGRDMKLAELIKLDLAKIGIDIKVTGMDSKSRDARVVAGDYELAIMYYGGLGGEPNMLKNYFYAADTKRTSASRSGTIGYRNDELNKLLDLQSKEKNPAKRKKQLFAAQKIIAEDVPMLMLFADTELCVYRPSKNNSWTGVYDHSKIDHPKLSFLKK